MKDIIITKLKNEYIDSQKELELWSNPLISGLLESVSLIPFMSPIVATLSKKIENNITIRIKSNIALLLQLLLESDSISYEDINDFDFIIEFSKLLDVVTRTRSISKIIYMKNLFDSTMKIDNRNYDVFEECLVELSQISDRELRILVELYNVRCSKKIKHEKQGKEFFEILSEEYYIDKETSLSLLSKLRRTGFCVEEQGTFSSGSGLEYYITSYGKQFIEYILEHNFDN